MASPLWRRVRSTRLQDMGNAIPKIFLLLSLRFDKLKRYLRSALSAISEKILEAASPAAMPIIAITGVI